jgi:hypothetical protein
MFSSVPGALLALLKALAFFKIAVYISHVVSPAGVLLITGPAFPFGKAGTAK